jgi:hypothetical protein
MQRVVLQHLSIVLDSERWAVLDSVHSEVRDQPGVKLNRPGIEMLEAAGGPSPPLPGLE